MTAAGAAVATAVAVLAAARSLSRARADRCARRSGARRPLLGTRSPRDRSVGSASSAAAGPAGRATPGGRGTPGGRDPGTVAVRRWFGGGPAGGRPPLLADAPTGISAPRSVTSQLVGVARWVGHQIRRRLGRPPDPHLDGWCGGAVLLALFVTPVSAGAAIVAALGVLLVPLARRRAARRRRAAQLVDELPEIIDLCRIAVEAGCTVRLALEQVVTHGEGVVVDALTAALADVARGRRLAQGLATVGTLGEPVRPFLESLLAAERYGAPVGPALERAAAEARSHRRRRGEEAARRAPIAMLFPLVLCTLPALGLLTVVPLLARSLPRLAP